MGSAVSFLLSWFVRGKVTLRQNKNKLPLPKQCHVTLNDDTVGDKAVFIIGDVHGCYDELVELMQLARTVEKNILFVLTGDLVGRGPKSVEVIQLLRSLGNDAWAVRGNHDEGTLREARRLRSSPDYELPDRYSWVKGLSDEDVEYLSELPYTISIPAHKALIVHAGIIPGPPLEQQQLNTLTFMRNIIEPDHIFSFHFTSTDKTDKGKCWASYWPGPDHVYFGHDAGRNFQEHPYATGLDTACLYGRHLTGVFTSGRKLAVSAKTRYK